MLDLMREAVACEADSVWGDVERVAGWIPPLWDLTNFVAVNPFLGFSATPILDASRVIGDGLGARVLPDIAFYRARLAENADGIRALAGAAARAGLDPSPIAQVLAGSLPAPTRAVSRVPTFAERLDQSHGTTWNDLVLRSIARWCAVHVVGGGTFWPGATPTRGLFGSWLEAARVDRSLDIAGLRGFRACLARVPEEPVDAIESTLERLEVPASDRLAYFYRLLGGLYGWASYFRRSTWESGAPLPGAIADLIAIRICADAAVLEVAGRHARASTTRPRPSVVEDEGVRLVLQEALEDGYVQGLVRKLPAAPGSTAIATPTPTPAPPSVQAVFCIDVRSEPLRRHLESQSPTVETRGFAGFFGVALSWHADEAGSSRCPVLLKPGLTVRQACPPKDRASAGLLKRIQVAPAAAFSFVEVAGLAYGVGLAADAVAWDGKTLDAEESNPFALGDPDADVSLQARLGLAGSILKNMSFGDRFARLVLLCGHEGRSANNPHAAGLDCGACGGHGGAINARVAAALLNDPTVRALLPGEGWNIPADTHFLPAVHDTSTDEVRLLDLEHAPGGHGPDIERLRGWLAGAGEAARRERAVGLGLGLGLEPDGRRPGRLARILERRSRDWSEVRPEWALARNATFIAARRCRTRGVDLEGRAFLHEYDAALDPDGSVLTLILSAPMVVASWINLQYFASTVDNRTFGAGDKTLHNRVGTVGVVLGNGGDLRTGLPAQSVLAPGGRSYHEPLRLQVVVEAPPERIDQVLDATPSVRELLENGWVRLFSLDRDRTRLSLRVADRGWEELDAATS